jgi:hypothetical protein
MPFPVAAVLSGVAGHFIASFIFKVVGAFGIGFVVWKGMDLLMNGARAEIVNMSAQLPADMLNMFFLLRLDDAISVIFGAIAIRIAFKTFGIGTNRGISLIRAGMGGS